jgi:hypothetical protein
MSTPLSPEEAARLAQALDPEAQARADAEREEQAARHRAEALLRETHHATNPQLEITKLFMRCGPRARREFLADAKAADPALFAEIMEGAR